MIKTEKLSRQPGNRFAIDPDKMIETLNRSRYLNPLALFAVHAAGCALMLTGPLLLLTAGSGAAYLSTHINGPLDWFLAGLCTALSLIGGLLSWQFFRLKITADIGVPVSRSQAPEFYAMLERRCGHFGAKPIDTISLCTETALEVDATPVRPLPFGHRYTVRAGAPLLFFLSHRQFRLALAGTIAASVAETSMLKRWISQACEDWPVILAALEAKPCLLSRLLIEPMRKIVQISNRLGQPYKKDWRELQGQWVRNNSDEQNLIDYLANQVVADAFFSKQYWPMILKAAERCPTPVVKAFSHLPLLLEKTLNRPLAERWLLQAQTISSNEQTNLRDLLATLQVEHLRWPGLPDQNAFSTLFSSNAVLKELDTYWKNEIEAEWRDRHHQYKADRTRFESLRERAEEQGLRGESALRFIKLTERFLGTRDALAMYRDTLENNRDDAKVCFAGGLALLRAGALNPGASALQRAATLDPKLSKRAQSLINEHKNAWIRDNETTTTVETRSVHKAIA